MSIILHKEKGINPKMMTTQCPICAEKVEAIALLGDKDYKDICPSCCSPILGGMRRSEKCPKCGQLRNQGKWAREELLYNENINRVEVCDKCIGYMEQGIIIIGVKDGESGNNPYRTGAFVLLKEEAVERLLNKEAFKEVKKSRVFFMEETAMKDAGVLDMINKNSKEGDKINEQD